jgi:hypothetical protein
MKLTKRQEKILKEAKNRDDKNRARTIQNLTGADLDFDDADWGEGPKEETNKN